MMNVVGMGKRCGDVGRGGLLMDDDVNSIASNFISRLSMMVLIKFTNLLKEFA